MMLPLLLTLTLTGSVERPYLDSALAVAAWLETEAIETEDGLTWDPRADDQVARSTDLYYGSSGPVIFFLALHARTDDETWLALARKGSDHLIARLPSDPADLASTALYSGIAGPAWVLEEMYRVTGDKRYRQAMLRALDLIEHAAENPDTDIINGIAGTGLFLLYAHDRTGREEALAAAIRIGDELITRARETPHGLEWTLGEEKTRIMPNFSHGTAGVAFFLTRLGRSTGNETYTKAAIRGAEHLLAIRNEDGLIHHAAPDGKNLYYLGWCHGPAGTSRLYHELGSATGDVRWRKAYDRALTSLMESGIPERRQEGFWNNVSVCCGTAGVASCVLDAHRLTGDRQFLDLLARLNRDLITRATRDETGMRWYQAENRKSPEDLFAQTGFMQGAAGIGFWLCRMDAFSRGEPFPIRLPDEIEPTP